MPLMLDGIALITDNALEDEAVQLHDPSETQEFGDRELTSRLHPGRPWGPFSHTVADPSPGEFIWPAWGLFRHACGRFYCHAVQATYLRAVQDERMIAVQGGGSDDLVPLILRIEADQEGGASGVIGNAARVEFPVYLLPPRPVAAPDPLITNLPGWGTFETSSGLYRLTVVDLRYFLRYRRVRPDLAGDIGCDLTWSDLYEILAEDAGITLTWDKVADEYLVPPDALSRFSGGDAAMALDSVAASIGHRIVARLDGTFHAQDFENAFAQRNAADQVAGYSGRLRSGGGDLNAAIL